MTPVSHRGVQRFLVGVFAAGSFVLHNYVSLNIGLWLALLQAVAYFFNCLARALSLLSSTGRPNCDSTWAA